MSGTDLVKLHACVWAEVLPRLALAGPSAELVADATDAAQALDRLDAQGMHTEAARLLAYALPRREAVWWGCMCARHTMPADLDPASRAALDATERWVFQGDDAVRREAFARAQAAGLTTPEAWVAVGAFWSGDSVAPSDQAAVPPAPYLAATAISGAVVLAAVRLLPQRRGERMARFTASGREIAGGGPGRLAPEPP